MLATYFEHELEHVRGQMTIRDPKHHHSREPSAVFVAETVHKRDDLADLLLEHFLQVLVSTNQLGEYLKQQSGSGG